MLRLKAPQGNLNCMIMENNGLYMMQINLVLVNKLYGYSGTQAIVLE
jgi:hypothetical protein